MTVPASLDPVDLLQRYVADIAPDVRCLTQFGQQLFAGPLIVWLRQEAGTGRPDLLAPEFRVECYGSDSRSTVGDLSWQLYRGLWAAWRAARFYDIGWISAITDIELPNESRLEAQPAEIYRYTSLSRFIIRTAQL